MAREDSGPQAALVATADCVTFMVRTILLEIAVDFFFLRRRKVRIELHVQSGCEHFRG